MMADPNQPAAVPVPSAQPNAAAAAPPGNNQRPPAAPQPGDAAAAPLTSGGPVQVNIQPDAQNAFLNRLTAMVSERAGPSAAFLRQVEGASLFVLMLSALGIVLILTFYRQPDTPAWQTERAVELLLTLAGTSVILALLSRNPNALTLIFGFLIIGALVVPTNDIIRFALLATGSDKTYRDFVSPNARGSSKSQLDRTRDLAMQIYQGLSDDGVIKPDTKAASVVEAVRTLLVREQDVQTFESVRQRGALELLVGLSSDDRKKELIYRYGQEDRFREDLEFLRQEGLISYIYDDVTTVDVLPPGRTLARRVEADRASADAGAADAAFTMPPDSEMSLLEGAALDGEVIPLTGTGEIWYKFEVPTAGVYEISAMAGDDIADPVLTLYRDREYFAYSDDTGTSDTGTSRNALISKPLETGRVYQLQLEEISYDPNATFDLRIRPRPSEPAGVSGSAPTAEPGSDDRAPAPTQQDSHNAAPAATDRPEVPAPAASPPAPAPPAPADPGASQPQ